MAQDQMSDVQEAMEAIPLTLNGQDEYDYDPEGVLNDLSIYAHAYDRIHVELIRRDNAKAKLVARAERAEKRRAKLKVVANG